MSSTVELFERYVLPTARRTVIFAKGKGSRMWDEAGREYVDFTGGIAVNSLGHAHPALTEVLAQQSQTLVHTSNLFYHRWQGELARTLVEATGAGKMFFTNSGAEANEGLVKLARLHGVERGAYEIITTINSFHGRTMAGISATGQDKVKKGFEPLLPGFIHVPFNDLSAIESAITEKTAAVLIEGIQGEGGVFPATQEYLLGLRKLTQERNILLLFDAVQCGYFRTGRFQSYERIFEGTSTKFLPDAIAMAKSMGAGFPLGAFWVSDQHAPLFTAGSHGTTYGGSPLACAVALKVWEVVQQEKLADNIRLQGERLKDGLRALQKKYPLIEDVRGFGGLVGMQLSVDAPQAMPHFHQKGLLAAGAANRTIRFLPPLNVTSADVDEALQRLDLALDSLQQSIHSHTTNS